MPVFALLSASIPLLSPVLRNNWKVPGPACNCLGSLSNFRCAAATDPRKACYLLNFAKKFPVLRRMSRRDRFVSDCAHHHPVCPNRGNRPRSKRGRFCGDLAAYFQRSRSLRTFNCLLGGFWPPVSASKNSVPSDWVSAP